MRTRGRPRELDYQFAGEAPEDFWWREYRPVTDVERPTILVRSDGLSWRAYIAGIRSARLDSTENSIQFNLVLAGDCGPGDENALALAIVGWSAAGLAHEDGLFIPGGLLDAQLPADKVERMLVSPGKATASAAADAVRAAFQESAPAADASLAASPPPQGNWIGGLAAAEARAAFGALAARLLGGGQPGSAVVLNLVEGEPDLAELPGWDGVLGVLAARPGPQLRMAVRTLGKAGAPQEPAAEGERSRSSRPWRRAALILAGAAAAVALAIFISWLVRNPPR